MKVPFKKSAPHANSAAIAQGRQIGTVIQIATLGSQPAFNPGEPAVDSLGVVIQLVGAGTVAKKMRVTDHPMGGLHQYLAATLLDPDVYDVDDALPLTLGRPVAVEILMNGRYARIESFHRPEDFELASAPTVADSSLILFADITELTRDRGKALFLKLHSEIRGWLSRRVRG